MPFKLFQTFLIFSVITGTCVAQQTLVERLPDPALLQSGVIGGQFTDRPGEEVSPVSVVTFGQPVEIGSVTIFMTDLFGGYPAGSSGTAILNIFDGDQLQAGDDTLSGGPHGLASTTVDYIATADGIEVTAADLDISLQTGTYLVGLTPILVFGTNSQEFIQDAGVNGQTTYLDNPGGALFIPIYGAQTINANIVDLPTPFTSMALRILSSVLKGDVNMDGFVNLLDVEPFIVILSGGGYQAEADINCDGFVNLLDVEPFITILSGG